MKRFLRWVGRTLNTKPTSAHRGYSFRPHIEPLDERLVLSGVSSAISIPHAGGIYSLSWTERDWYTVDASNGVVLDTPSHVIKFEGTTQYDLGQPPLKTCSIGQILALGATVDSNTGDGAVFVLTGFEACDEPPADLSLSYCDSLGTWHSLWDQSIPVYANAGIPKAYGSLGATRDGHVYAESADGTDVRYFDSKGNSLDLGAPSTAILAGSGSLAASVGPHGNEVFALGADGSIYLNASSTFGDWKLIDSRAYFTQLSSTPNNTVFALTNDGRLFQETYVLELIPPYNHYSWAGQDISGGMLWTQISADTDASGQAEVYAVQAVPIYIPNGNGTTEYLISTGSLYLHDQGSWTQKDSDVYDVAAAGSGYFYDVNYDNGNYSAWLYQPSGNPYWNFLGDQLQ
jgi:hypothetical protein